MIIYLRTPHPISPVPLASALYTRQANINRLMHNMAKLDPAIECVHMFSVARKTPTTAPTISGFIHHFPTGLFIPLVDVAPEFSPRIGTWVRLFVNPGHQLSAVGQSMLRSLQQAGVRVRATHVHDSELPEVRRFNQLFVGHTKTRSPKKP